MKTNFYGDVLEKGHIFNFNDIKLKESISLKEVNGHIEKIYDIMETLLKNFRFQSVRKPRVMFGRDADFLNSFFLCSELKKTMKYYISRNKMTLSYAFNQAVEKRIQNIDKLALWVYAEEDYDYYYGIVNQLREQMIIHIDRYYMHDFCKKQRKEIIIYVKDFKIEYLHQLPKQIRGFICEKMEHSLRLRDLMSSIEVPVAESEKELFDGTYVLLDTIYDKLIINPTQRQTREFLKTKYKFTFKLNETPRVDRERIKVYVNLASTRELKKATSKWFDGLGIFRTEYFYMTRGYPPSLEELIELFVEVIEAFKGGKIIIRLPDFNDLKTLDYEKGLFTDLTYLAGNAHIFDRCMQAIGHAINRTQQQVIISVPMLRAASEIPHWKDDFDIHINSIVPEHLSPLFCAMMETESATMFFEDYRIADMVIIGLNDLNEEAMDVSRFAKLDLKEFEALTWDEVNQSHKDFRKNGVKLLHYVAGRHLEQEEILRRFINSGFVNFCFQISKARLVEEVLFNYESTRGRYVGVHKQRKEAAKAKKEKKKKNKK
ncbi:MAG: putative PEP-binding protein [Acholeplasmataceae bacterium]|nr:hypothetical protein [Acholeplasmataceae bacterium]